MLGSAENTAHVHSNFHGLSFREKALAVQAALESCPLQPLRAILHECPEAKLPSAQVNSETCLADQGLRKIYELASDPKFFYRISLDELEYLKSFLSILQENRKSLDFSELKLSLLKELVLLLAPNATDPARAFARLHDILSQLEVSPPVEHLDIRDVALYEDLIFNPNLHKKLNAYGRSVKASRPYLLSGKSATDQKKIDQYYLRKDFIDRLTNTGRFLPQLKSIRSSLLEKSLAILDSEKTGQPYQPHLTAHEMWVAVHDLKNELDLRKAARTPSFDPVTTKIESYLPVLEEAFEVVQSRAYSSLNHGDFMFAKIQRELDYFGRKSDKRIRALRFFTWSDYGHVALLLKSSETSSADPAELFHTGFQGVSINESGLEAAYIYDTYRIHLNQLMTEELITALNVESEKTGIDPKIIFKTKIEQYNQVYRDFLRDESVQPSKWGERIKIITTPEAQERSVYLNLSPFHHSSQNIFDRVEQERKIPDNSEVLSEDDLVQLKKKIEIDEICSEFAFVEYIRYVHFIEVQLKQDLKVNLSQQLHFFNLSFADHLELKGLHPGSLSRILDSLVTEGKAMKLRPGGGGLFAD